MRLRVGSPASVSAHGERQDLEEMVGNAARGLGEWSVTRLDDIERLATEAETTAKRATAAQERTLHRRDQLQELKQAIPRRTKATSFLQSLPRPRRWLRYYVPLMPLAIEQLDLSGYDIVISSSHAVAKGVITGPRQLHLSYVHTPMRYAWDLQHEYLRASGLDRGLRGWAARLALQS